MPTTTIPYLNYNKAMERKENKKKSAIGTQLPSIRDDIDAEAKPSHTYGSSRSSSYCGLYGQKNPSSIQQQFEMALTTEHIAYIVFTDTDTTNDSTSTMFPYDYMQNTHVKLNLNSSSTDKKSCFLMYLDVMIRGLILKFGDENGAVDLNSFSIDAFDEHIGKPMKSTLDIYPIIVSFVEGSPWISEMESFRTVTEDDGTLNDYGIKLRLSTGECVLHFRTSK
jgi:hypothetical protein